MTMDDTAGLVRRFIRSGVVLLLLALLTGLAIPRLANPRMGLTSHLQALSHGMLLVLFGLIAPRLQVSARTLLMTYWLAFYGAVLAWLATFAAALLPGGAFLALASQGHRGTPVQEGLITAGAASSALAILGATLIVLWGLRGGPVRTGTPSAADV